MRSVVKSLLIVGSKESKAGPMFITLLKTLITTCLGACAFVKNISAGGKGNDVQKNLNAAKSKRSEPGDFFQDL